MLYARLENAVQNMGPDQVWDAAGAILDDLAEGRTSIDAVRHPLGFICLPIVRDDSPEGVCLHYWPGRTETGDLVTSRYHCHSWSLLSHVLVGAVGNLRLDLVPGDEFQLFEAVSSGLVDRLVPTGRLTGVRCAEPEIHRAGETYGLAAGAFHASVATYADVSVTLVLGRMVPGAADITLGAADMAERRVVRRTIGTAEARRVAREILRLRPGVLAAL
jgi:hypothetical protein